MSTRFSFSVAGWCRPAALFLLAPLLLASCKKDDDTAEPQPTVAYGPTVAIGDGTGRSFVASDAAGNPTEIGVRLTASALNNLPTTPAMGMMYDLALPATASSTPYDHISFDWNPNGHEPAGVYTVPHFDAHFYMQPMAVQHAITLDDPKGDIFPDSMHLPAGYNTPPNVVPGRTVPMMGRHWTDPTSPEYQPGGAFSSTFIYGTYDGHVTFLEPMFTKAMLVPTVNFSAPIKQPRGSYEMTGKYHPMKYNIRYEAATQEYIISLSELVKR